MFNVNYHRKGELGILYVSANWSRSVSDFFCLRDLLTFFIKKLSSALGES